MSDENNSLLHQFPYAPGRAYTDEAIDKVAEAPPLKNITRAHLPRGYNNYKPPLLHFGWSFEANALLKWAAENGISTTRKCSDLPDGSDDDEHDSLWAVTEPEVLAVLAAKAGAPELRIEVKLAMHSKGYFLLTISSNYRFFKDRMERVTQERIEALDRYL
ncbi:hypothetical protein BJ322DRAFT_1064497, partial [Thelephora terrestris]